MLRKAVWLIVLLAIAAIGRYGLEQVAGATLHTAAVLIEHGDYDGARQRLDRIDSWFAWTEAGKTSPDLRATMDAKIAAERRREEAERRQRDLERAQAALPADPGGAASRSGSGSGGVYHGLNRAESLRKKKP